MAIIENALEAMKDSMSPEDFAKAKLNAEQEIFAIKLANLREKQGLKQSELTSFTQTAVSKLESRKDMKISTLIEYLDDIGMGIEIKVYPKTQSQTNKSEVLLKV